MGTFKVGMTVNIKEYANRALQVAGLRDSGEKHSDTRGAGRNIGFQYKGAMGEVASRLVAGRPPIPDYFADGPRSGPDLPLLETKCGVPFVKKSQLCVPATYVVWTTYDDCHLLTLTAICPGEVINKLRLEPSGQGLRPGSAEQNYIIPYYHHTFEYSAA